MGMQGRRIDVNYRQAAVVIHELPLRYKLINKLNQTAYLGFTYLAVSTDRFTLNGHLFIDKRREHKTGQGPQCIMIFDVLYQAQPVHLRHLDISYNNIYMISYRAESLLIYKRVQVLPCRHPVSSGMDLIARTLKRINYYFKDIF